MTEDIHSCNYYCQRPACVLAQRDELRDKFFNPSNLHANDCAIWAASDAAACDCKGNSGPLKFRFPLPPKGEPT